MVLSGVVVDLVDWYGGVDNGSLDGFTLDHRLDGLVDVVVDVLAGNDGVHGVRVGGVTNKALVLELLGLTGKTGLNLLGVAMVDVAVLYSDQVVGVRLRKDLAVGDGLHGSVVVVLVNLLVDDSGDVFVLSAVHSLVQDGRSNTLMNSGVMVSGLGHKLLDGDVGFGSHDVGVMRCEG